VLANAASTAQAPTKLPFCEKDLRSWRLLDDFRQALASALIAMPEAVRRPDAQRLALVADYLSLFLFGLFNPVIRTARALTAATSLERVRREVCRRSLSQGRFSECQHLVDPQVLEHVFTDLASELANADAGDPRLRERPWMARDGSLFAALPRMAWALYGAGKAGTAKAVRLHLSLHLVNDKPVRAQVHRGKDCERAVWKEHWQAGDAYVGDRYFGQNYRLFGELSQKTCAYVLRLREEAIITVQTQLPVTEADQKAGVVRQAWVQLGCNDRYRSQPVRIVWVQAADGKELVLVTNLDPEQLPAELVSRLYRQRWQIEMFFRWFKCVLGCGHWLAEGPRGAAIQLYLALIASVLLQLYTGRRPTKRMHELIQLYFLGWASLEELTRGLQREMARLQKAQSRKTN
jgi:IS4 transposase